LRWVEGNCRFSVRTAQLYCQAARQVPHLDAANAQRVALLPLREAVRELSRQRENRPVAATSETCTIDDLQSLVAAGKRFGTIYADPPWRYDNRASRAAAENHYPTLTVDEIAALPIAALPAADCHCHLWVTKPFLPDGSY